VKPSSTVQLRHRCWAWGTVPHKKDVSQPFETEVSQSRPTILNTRDHVKRNPVTVYNDCDKPLYTGWEGLYGNCKQQTKPLQIRSLSLAVASDARVVPEAQWAALVSQSVHPSSRSLSCSMNTTQWNWNNPTLKRAISPSCC
jgi:hypothetical protein